VRYNHNLFAPVKAKKTLVTPEEKQGILDAMRQHKASANYWAATFKRLPETILKFAKEAGIELA
jgi:hypothetical protein